MKSKLFLLMAGICLAMSVSAQTNVFPSSGYVGIGTTTPSFNLNVDPIGEGGILIGNPSTGYGGYTSLKLSISAMSNGFSEIQSVKSSGSQWGDIILNRWGGNVGIGTANPMNGYKLDVNGKMRASYYNLNAYSTNFDDFALYVTTDVGTTLASAGPTNIAFRTNNNERMRVDNEGNVGIGTTTPQNKLDVNGTIRAKEVKVETGWADFVFAPTYKLRPLTEVEQFIKTNGHLPEIPKAEEVQQNGVNLGEMQTKLLQKVEELTLYSIQQDKKIEAQAKENAELKKELKELKELITNKLK